MVETALARALEAAAASGQWSTVELIARELEARRLSRQGGDAAGAEVVELRRRREGA